MLIGLCGRNGVGKTTVGNILEKNGYKNVAFGQAVKDICYILSNLDKDILSGERRIERETYKDKNFNKTGREWLQLIGTLMREQVHPDIWIKIVERQLVDNKKIVITDCRYENEYNRIKELGGKIIVIYRTEDDLVKKENTHHSIWSFVDFISQDDYYLKNDKNLINSLSKIIVSIEG
jgi:dephospho-CoA kinase